ncbi:MAG: PD40 domain-containing protein [Lewinella sp.]|nr:PD40 domain-containing protein [Lewinella sp.]
MQRWLLPALGLFLSISLAAQSDDGKEWDVNDPPGDWGWHDVSFSTTEGTWMNLDVSPDGQTIVFDMLGDIYTMPAAGGTATPLRTGIAWEIQPRFSPDGSQILFTSDAGGGDNIWVMDADGEDARQVTKESFRLLNNAVWMPDGNYIVARKHFTSGRSLGAGEMWMYHLTGGSGFQLTERKNDQQDVNEPSVSPDGRYVYFSEDMYPGGYFQYNKDPNSQIYVIKRYDRQEGKVETVVEGPGGACRPQVSNDGTKLAFVRRVRTESVLYIYDLETGEMYPIFEGLTKDQQEAWAIFGAYTGFDWMPEDDYVVIWGEGKIWQVSTDPASKVAPREIPFTVNVHTQVAETLQQTNPVFTDNFDVKVIRHAVTSPDGESLVFSAVGFLWQMELPDGRPRRLTEADVFEFEPAFSPDGATLAYVTWDDQEKGSIRLLDLASGRTQAITEEKAIYRTPAWSPDGETIVYVKEGGNQHQGYTFCQEPGIYTMPAKGGEATLVLPRGEFPVFSADGERIFFQSGGYLFGSLTKTYSSIKLDGTDEKKHVESKYAQRFSLSPDNQWIAWSELYKVYIAPFPQTGQTVGLTHDTKAVPVAQVARDAGINLHWSTDSQQLHWTLGNEYFSDRLTERFDFLKGAGDSIPPMDTVGLRIALELPMDKPEGRIALTNARIITMEGDQVIEEGTILINGNVIEAVGPASRVRVPREASIIDCSGKTIMPGIVDVHGHLGDFRYGLSPEQNWLYYANLAYGVTTAHDPSSNSEMIFSHSEMIKAGQIVGPRLYSTGTILYGADGDFKAVINSLEDARSAIRRTQAYGAFSVKSYNQPRRNQRQQVMQAARELGIIVVPEGGSTFYHNMTEVVDGHTGIEHNIPVAPLYRDVVQLWAATDVHNTPTLIVNYGGINGEYYWYQHTNVWEKERLLTFTPRPVVDSRARHRTMVPEEEYENGHILTSESLKSLTDAGVEINLGAHGQLQGLGAHWELWMLEQGGMTNMEALQAATINGARYLGMDSEIGSLRRGKLADLIVIEGNPLEDLRQSEQVQYTMINGRLYDAATMNEIGNYDRPREPFFFEQHGSGLVWPLDAMTGAAMPTQCACQK